MLQILGLARLAQFRHNLALILHHIHARRLLPDALRGKPEEWTTGGLKELLREPYELGGYAEESALTLFLATRHRKGELERKQGLNAGDAHLFLACCRHSIIRVTSEHRLIYDDMKHATLDARGNILMNGDELAHRRPFRNPRVEPNARQEPNDNIAVTICSLR